MSRLVIFLRQRNGIKLIKYLCLVLYLQLLYQVRTSICTRKFNKNCGWFRSHFLEKTMGYSTGKFSENGSFFKMATTWKIEVRISSNFLHNISTSICIRKCNKNWGWFRSHFSEKSMGYIVQGIFQKMDHFLKWP